MNRVSEIPAVILCGGKGLRLRAEMGPIPKALVPIAGRALLSHVLGTYLRQGVREFHLCLGYGGDRIRRAIPQMLPRGRGVRVHPHETGASSETGERIRRILRHLPPTVFLTYADGLADLSLAALLRTHRAARAAATVTVVRPRLPFGVVRIEGRRVRGFIEKPPVLDWVNGGFFVCEREALETIRPGEVWERGPLERLAKSGRLAAHRHLGFWRCMDTYKDAVDLDGLARAARRAPWVRAA